MTLKYASIDNIAKRLAGRITISTVDADVGVFGMTGTVVGVDLVDIMGQSVEEFMDMFLGMVYIMPLQRSHSFLSSIAERLIVADIYTSYFPVQAESAENSDGFAGVLRKQALNDFQCLFSGFGIFVPGSDSVSLNIQNDPASPQMQNKAIILPGESLKKFIGYDYDSDGLADTDLFKYNANVPPSFYYSGNLENIDDNETVIDGVRVRDPRYIRNNLTPEIDFYSF